MNEDKEKEPCVGTALKSINPFDRNEFHENKDQDGVVIFENNPIGNSKFPIVAKDWVVYIRITKNTTWYLGIPPYFVIGSRWVSDDGCSIEDEWMDGLDAFAFGLGIFLAVFGLALQILVGIYR